MRFITLERSLRGQRDVHDTWRFDVNNNWLRMDVPPPDVEFASHGTSLGGTGILYAGAPSGVKGTWTTDGQTWSRTTATSFGGAMATLRPAP